MLGGIIFDQIGQSLAITLLVLVVAQLVVVWIFVRAMRKYSVPLLSDAECPPATVVLCLRGTDPFLPRCIEAILSQDYLNYELLIMVDHREDSAWRVAEECVAQLNAKNVRMVALTNPLPTASLKCSSLVQALGLIDSGRAFFAQLDADTIPHRTWLRELATKLADPKMGAATGNRWYMPPEGNYGSLVRYLWNSAAVPQMYLHKICWGGTLAFKMDAAKKANLAGLWSKAFSEDTMAFSQLKKVGYDVGFVPSLMMVNHETCDVKGFYFWVRRQLLVAYLYHPRFGMVVLHGLVTAIVPLLTLAWSAIYAAQGNWMAAVGMLGSLVIYQLSLLPMLALLEVAVGRAVAHRGESTNWIKPAYLPKLVVAVVVTQVVYTTALISAILLRKVEWRGVSYIVKGSWDIRLMEYLPYKKVQQDEKHSL